MLRGAAAARGPAPPGPRAAFVPGGSDLATVRGQCTPGGAPVRLGTGHGRQGLHELPQGVRCLENFRARGRPRWEVKTPQLAQDIRAIVEPHTQADPELKTARRYSNRSAADVLAALQTKKGYAPERMCRGSQVGNLTHVGSHYRQAA